MKSKMKREQSGENDVIYEKQAITIIIRHPEDPE